MSKARDNRRRRQRAARKMGEWRLDREWDGLPATCPLGHRHLILLSARTVDRVRRCRVGARFEQCPGVDDVMVADRNVEAS